MWWRSATSMAISSRIEPPGWMIAVTPRLGRELDPVGEREVGVRGHDRELGPVAGAAQRDLDRHQRGWPGRRRSRPSRRCVPGRWHWTGRGAPRARRTAGRSAPRASGGVWSRPGAARGRAPCSSWVSTSRPPADALEVEAGDAVVAHPLGRVGRHGEELQPRLGAQDPERRLAEAGATMASNELAAISRAVAPSSSRLTPTMPPKAATGSLSRACR